MAPGPRPPESDPDFPRPWLRFYPPNVAPRLEVPNEFLTDALHRSVERWPDRTALIYYGARWSYRGLWQAVERWASGLRQLGVRPRDRVALYLPNCPAYPIAFFGTLRAGATVVQVSPLYLGDDLARLLDDAEPRAVVTVEMIAPHLTPLLARRPSIRVIWARLRSFYPIGLRPFVNMVLRRRGYPTGAPRGAAFVRWREVASATGTVPALTGDPAREVAVLQYTGGTTGDPKAAMLTHRCLRANAAQVAAWNTRAVSGSEVVLATIPLFHIYGLTVALLNGLFDGGTVILQTRPDIAELLKLIDRYRPTQLPGVPALYQAINMSPEVQRHNLRSISVCISGSAPLLAATAHRFEELTGAAVVEGYGLTEASPVTHANPIEGEHRIGSVGLPLPDTDQRIVDPATGRTLTAPGAVGELWVRGPQVMAGYYRRPEETADVLVDGWLRTGDAAQVDADGFAYIVDRLKDMINVGGLKVYPREVEEVLATHPAVAEVTVVGLPDAIHGEVVVAVVVRRPGTAVRSEELIEYVRGRIAHYKAPRRIEFREELPRTGVQKVLRRTLREQLLLAAPA
ncbi:MAG: long-chain-fatty-acid--CoA ligase [Thermoplasmata archaeon]